MCDPIGSTRPRIKAAKSNQYKEYQNAKGNIQKDEIVRKTAKLTEGLTILKGSDPYFQITELTTNSDIFLKLKELGFTYNGQQWHMSKRPKVRPVVFNEHTQQSLPLKEVHFNPVTITPIAADRLEMCMSEGQLDGLQNVIDAMHTLGFKVEVKIVGTK